MSMNKSYIKFNYDNLYCSVHVEEVMN